MGTTVKNKTNASKTALDKNTSECGPNATPPNHNMIETRPPKSNVKAVKLKHTDPCEQGKKRS